MITDVIELRQPIEIDFQEKCVEDAYRPAKFDINVVNFPQKTKKESKTRLSQEKNTKCKVIQQ